ncbi:MAG: AbiJ-NTD4 domain-containing protein [Bacteriovoracia bacterium]
MKKLSRKGRLFFILEGSFEREFSALLVRGIKMSELTFSQRMGLASLPEQLRSDELSGSLRNRAWSAIFEDWQQKTSGGWLLGENETLVKDLCINLLDIPADEVHVHLDSLKRIVKPILLEGPFPIVMDFLEYYLRHPKCPKRLAYKIGFDFENCRAAYRFNFDEMFFYPITSQEQAQAIEESLAVISKEKYSGASEHLAKASSELMAGKFESSVRESIHSVESVACIITKSPKATLGEALKRLSDHGIEIHTAFKGGLEKLYGYSSDERGVRHSSLNEVSGVDEADALFMFGACASFCSYLIEKAKTAKID